MNKNISAIGIGFTICVLNLASARADTKADENFAKAKSMTLEMVDKKIEDLKATKGCVQKANDRSDLQACRAEAREERKELREHLKSRRDEMRERRERSKNENKMERKDQPGETDMMERKN